MTRTRAKDHEVMSQEHENDDTAMIMIIGRVGGKSAAQITLDALQLIDPFAKVEVYSRETAFSDE